MKLYQNTAKSVAIVNEKHYYHENMNGLVFHEITL